MHRQGGTKMTSILKVILIGSIILNILAVWGLFHYIMYGGNPLLELKRKLTGTAKHVSHSIPYAEENEKIHEEIAQGRTDSLRVIFFGASITHGWNLDKYFTKIHPVNRGVGGFVSDLLIKYKSNVLDLKPRAVVIKLCSINIRPQIPMYELQDGMDMMVQLAKANGIIPIVSTIIPSGKPSARIGDFSVKDSLASFNNWVREYADTNSLALIDYAEAIRDDDGFLPRDCSVDPVHINDKGYDIIAKAAQPVIYEALGIE